MTEHQNLGLEPGEARDEPSVAGNLGNVTDAVTDPPQSDEEPATEERAEEAAEEQTDSSDEG